MAFRCNVEEIVKRGGGGYILWTEVFALLGKFRGSSHERISRLGLYWLSCGKHPISAKFSTSPGEMSCGNSPVQRRLETRPHLVQRKCAFQLGMFI